MSATLLPVPRLSLLLAVPALFPQSAATAPAAGERPKNPDTIELTARIRDIILKTSAEEEEKGKNNPPAAASASAFKPYQEVMNRAEAPKRFDMAPIPAGEFLMGGAETEPGRCADEGPRVRVKIDAFWMGATEVTWDVYMPFMVTDVARFKDGGKKNPPPDDPAPDAVSSPTAPYTDMTFGMGQAGFPAISMTPHAANKFCQWLSALTGHYHRLPTEAEWEYAARAGTVTAWSFGDDVTKLGEYARWFENSDGVTHPVGKKKPNPWGLYDMHGNVCEWVRDQYSPDFYGALAGLSPGAAAPAPLNKPVTIHPRGARGGHWDDDPPATRSAARRGSKAEWNMLDPLIPKSRWYYTSTQFVGFRIVRPVAIPSLEEMHDAWNEGFPAEK